MTTDYIDTIAKEITDRYGINIDAMDYWLYSTLDQVYLTGMEAGIKALMDQQGEDVGVVTGKDNEL